MQKLERLNYLPYVEPDLLLREADRSGPVPLLDVVEELPARAKLEDEDQVVLLQG